MVLLRSSEARDNCLLSILLLLPAAGAAEQHVVYWGASNSICQCELHSFCTHRRVVVSPTWSTGGPQPPCHSYAGDLSFGASSALSSPQPVQLPGGLPFVALAAGRTHACGLLANGSAYCVGDNARGALGLGASVPRSMTPLPVDSNRSFVAVAAGWEFTCAQAPRAELWCWGRNDFGQLCDGSTQDKATPVRSAAAYMLTGTTAGSLHACGINGSAAGPGVCWG